MTGQEIKKLITKNKKLGDKIIIEIDKYILNEFSEHIELLEIIGFVETGKLPDFYYRYGKYHDYLIMSMTKAQYLHNK